MSVTTTTGMYSTLRQSYDPLQPQRGKSVETMLAVTEFPQLAQVFDEEVPFEGDHPRPNDLESHASLHHEHPPFPTMLKHSAFEPCLPCWSPKFPATAPQQQTPEVIDLTTDTVAWIDDKWIDGLDNSESDTASWSTVTTEEAAIAGDMLVWRDDTSCEAKPPPHVKLQGINNDNRNHRGKDLMRLVNQRNRQLDDREHAMELKCRTLKLEDAAIRRRLRKLKNDESAFTERRVKLQKIERCLLRRHQETLPSADCFICFEAPIDCILVPCGHMVACMACAAKLKRVCCICNAKFAVPQKIYRA